ncbi:DUF2378 family protein [Corallococcus exiguus]|uniref:DUF2378 family protein n=1 Tax=Corallococcus exiguus TaxID=83462 RepID=UPI001C266319|nr:DUF2378 family protein [Corallococcus exiguus]NRD45222.1 hypothetical protein [Corallococcus exiguus]
MIEIVPGLVDGRGFVRTLPQATVIEDGLAKAGAQNLRVEPFDFDGHACSYRIQ